MAESFASRLAISATRQLARVHSVPAAAHKTRFLLLPFLTQSAICRDINRTNTLKLRCQSQYKVSLEVCCPCKALKDVGIRADEIITMVQCPKNMRVVSMSIQVGHRAPAALCPTRYTSGADSMSPGGGGGNGGDGFAQAAEVCLPSCSEQSHACSP